MNLIPKILFLFFSFLLSSACAQDTDFTSKQRVEANTAINTSYLSSEEKNLIYYTNLLRTNPKLFAKVYVKPYLDSAKFNSSNYIKSLNEYLLDAEPMPILTPEKILYDEALKHSTNMGKAGKLGHESSDGKSFEERLSFLTDSFSLVQENCQYGFSKGLDILMDLLIDEGIEDLGHRYTLMNTRLRFIGVSIYPHKKFNVNCVIDFGGKKLN